MRKFAYIVLGAVLLAGCTADMEEQTVSLKGELSEKILNESRGCIEGTLLVRFNAEAESRLAEGVTRSGATRTGLSGVDALLDEVQGYAVEPIFVVTEKNRDKVYSRGLHLWYELRFNEECDVEALALKLAKVDEVDRVQFSHKICRVGDAKIMAVEPPTRAQTLGSRGPISFNDILAKYQWSLNNLGDRSEVMDKGYIAGLAAVEYGADINVVPAWKLCKGDPSIVVAVVDEGVMYTHEDLADNMWINSAEVANDGIDNDNNGYVDDIHGYNFVRMESTISWNNYGDSGHGTHVAGIVSAVNNNKLGVCGIAGGSGNKDGVKIMSIQTFRGEAGASPRNTAKAIQYAADNGAHILQCSWGYTAWDGSPYDSGIKNDNGYKSACRLEAEAIDYFVANGGDENGPIEGGLAIFAGGNDGYGFTGYPAAYKPCVAVAAISPSLRPTYYTNFGIGTDIAAPGGEGVYANGAILSTVPEEFSDPSIPNYGMMQGTSQACPHVSGVAALGLSYAKQLGKRYSASEFRSMLLSATNNIDPFLTGSLKITYENGATQTISYPAYKGKLGAGYLDAYKLLLQIDGTPYVVVETNKENSVSLARFFGDGVHNAKLHKIEISDEDRAAIGLGDCTFSAGKLNLTCSKSGVATISITLLVGGGSLGDKNLPYPIEVTKRFVLMAKGGVGANGGWL